jgi:integrase/recombinase XerC
MLVDNFIQYLQFEKRYSKHTVLAYQEDLSQFTEFAEIKSPQDWLEINHHVVRAWIVFLIENKHTNRSVSRKLSCLRSFYKWLVSNDYARVNPMLKIKAPKIEKRLPQFAKQSEMNQDKANSLFGDDFEGLRDELLVEVLYQTGIRLSELINLHNSNIHPQSIKVLGKRNKERIIPIGSELFHKIQTYQNSTPDGPDKAVYLFVSKKGLKLNEKFVYRKINSYLGSVTNLQKKSPHVLRHTFATHMLNNGSGMETLKELLGHSNLSATQVYTHNSFAQINTIYSQAHPRGHKKK